MWVKIDEELPTIGNTGIHLKGISTYLCESVDDISSLPTSNVAFASKAVIIGTGEIYLFSPSRTWMKYGGISSI